MNNFSNSPLVNYTRISPNKTVNRNHTIDTITIHCVVGQLSVERLGDIFAQKNGASCNYGIGTGGAIGMYVEEKDRSWCSSSASNDNRAITIECASDTTPPYAINQEVYKALVKLLADICKRNKIDSLKWKNDKSLIGQIDKQNMTVHRWFANKSCPGDYIFNRLSQIANEVNSKLEGADDLSKEEVLQIIAEYEAAKTARPESDWSKQEGAFAKANAMGLISSTGPQSEVTREQLAAVLGRLGLLK